MSGFEQAGRAAKVAKILAATPAGSTRDEIATIAAWLESMTVEQRSRFALAAGCKTAPSDTTWTAVVAEAKARRTADEIFARAARTVAL